MDELAVLGMRDSGSSVIFPDYVRTAEGGFPAARSSAKLLQICEGFSGLYPVVERLGFLALLPTLPRLDNRGRLSPRGSLLESIFYRSNPSWLACGSI